MKRSGFVMIQLIKSNKILQLQIQMYLSSMRPSFETYDRVIKRGFSNFTGEDASVPYKSVESPTDLQVTGQVTQHLVTDSFISKPVLLDDKIQHTKASTSVGYRPISAPKSSLAYERSSLNTYASPSPASPRVASISPQQHPQNGKCHVSFVASSWVPSSVSIISFCLSVSPPPHLSHCLSLCLSLFVCLSILSPCLSLSSLSVSFHFRSPCLSLTLFICLFDKVGTSQLRAMSIF